MLPQIKVPAMGMFGDKDVIVDPMQWQPMQQGIPHAVIERFPMAGHFPMLEEPCLLYTSDAADERSSVDLGGRRIIKKTKEA